MTDERLAELKAQSAVDGGMTSHCEEYACRCHFSQPELIAEVERLQIRNAALETRVDEMRPDYLRDSLR